MNEGAPYTAIKLLQAKATGLAKSEPQLPRTVFDERYENLTIDTKTLELGKFRSGLQLMLARAWEILDKISDGKRFVVQPLATPLADDLHNRSPGYSFLSEAITLCPGEDLISVLLRSKRWTGLLFKAQNNKIRFNIHRLGDLCTLYNEFNTLLAVLMHWMLYAKYRGTEAAQHLLRNGVNRRNLMVLCNQLVMISRYSKISVQTHMDTCVPSFVPPVLQELMLEFFAGGHRDLQALSSRHYYEVKSFAECRQ